MVGAAYTSGAILAEVGADVSQPLRLKAWGATPRSHQGASKSQAPLVQSQPAPVSDLETVLLQKVMLAASCELASEGSKDPCIPHWQWLIRMIRPLQTICLRRRDCHIFEISRHFHLQRHVLPKTPPNTTTSGRALEIPPRCVLRQKQENWPTTPRRRIRLRRGTLWPKKPNALISGSSQCEKQNWAYLCENATDRTKTQDVAQKHNFSRNNEFF